MALEEKDRRTVGKGGGRRRRRGRKIMRRRRRWRGRYEYGEEEEEVEEEEKLERVKGAAAMIFAPENHLKIIKGDSHC
ncbi:hypothetical protein PoB_001822300 [Plakobranchus ocellatus]|uniref:Uncharacterized protein n=1 Tax=Plakobranchus ocellatus TaxID=259542 RepID=A0AAV3ZBC0_9GAST|nr:hypothetical protein PoB_001822300 [Plakobranchus ocellatus]